MDAFLWEYGSGNSDLRFNDTEENLMLPDYVAFEIKRFWGFFSGTKKNIQVKKLTS